MSCDYRRCERSCPTKIRDLSEIPLSLYGATLNERRNFRVAHRLLYIFHMGNIHERALEIVGRYFNSETEVIAILQELDSGRKYIEKDCRSLFEYATKILKLSESVAFTFINVGRKAKEVPALQAAIDRHELSVPTARKITSVITPENSAGWLELAKTLTQLMLEREVARVNPKAAVREIAKYVTAERLKLELGVSEELLRKLRRIQDLESSSKNRAATLEDTLETMVELYLEKHDPIRIEKRVQKNVGLRFLRTVKPKSLALVKRQVLARDDARCTQHNKDGTRCSQTRYLHLHHVVPKEFGGRDTAENLTLLCSFHHRQFHERLLL